MENYLQFTVLGFIAIQFLMLGYLIWRHGRQNIQQAMSVVLERLISESETRFRREVADQSERTRTDITHTGRVLREEVAGSIRGMSSDQLTQLEIMSRQWATLHETNDKRVRELQFMVEQKLDRLHQNNSERLEAMRQTVDEKLQGTLERRLGESFKQVSDRLEQVQRGLGEMQGLAIGVGDLKRVLTNVKTRGTWGEAQLSMLLEQVLTPDQYEANSKLGRRSNDVVEFAVKLPGRDDEGSTVFLPIDSKFPQEQYQRLLIAQDAADAEGLSQGRRELEMAIKVAARDVQSKYVHPPHTTDFAIIYLPTEGLYAEVLRIPGIIERMQVDYRVTIAGPTTLAALLNSLQMGFKTLAIQKRSGEVWKVLGAVKSEFGKFGDLLEGVQKSIQTAANKIEDATKKTRTIESKLRGVEVIPGESAQILGLTEDVGDQKDPVGFIERLPL
ncbi:MAG: DNA recombination protein RmuC [Proteobacteria bacterium]|nr:DNA recombination protein RmuC [Pseudomonadota bacterium]